MGTQHESRTQQKVDNNKLIYRFRSIDRLLKFRELEDCYIFFSGPTELNDPGERLRNFVWKGDAIVWSNFFRHYFRCLLMFCIHFRILAHDVDLDERDVRVTRISGKSVYFDSRGATMFESLCDTMFKRSNIGILIDSLTNRTVKRNELIHYVMLLHLPALLEADKLIQSPMFSHAHSSICHLDSRYLSKLFASIDAMSSDSVEAHFLASELARVDHDIVRRMNILRPSNRLERNRNVLLLDFPVYFLRRIETLVYPDWYTACFSKSYSSPSLSGHYAGGHRGVCLVFETKQDDHGYYMDLKERCLKYDIDTGESTSVEEQWRKFHFQDVVYDNALPEIDFFRNLATIPRIHLDADWYTDKGGARSDCATHLYSGDIETWRNRLWETYQTTISQKSTDWEYEEESRLLLNEMFSSFEVPEYRKLRYRFQSIRGVILGVDMNHQDKLMIHDVLLRLCRRTGHKVFLAQAHYDDQSARVVSIL